MAGMLEQMAPVDPWQPSRQFYWVRRAGLATALVLDFMIHRCRAARAAGEGVRYAGRTWVRLPGAVIGEALDAAGFLNVAHTGRISQALITLRMAGIIAARRSSSNRLDRTLWYAFVDEATYLDDQPDPAPLPLPLPPVPPGVDLMVPGKPQNPWEA